MTNHHGARSRRFALAAALGGTALLGSIAAQAGSCPADQVLTTPRGIENAPDIGVDRAILQEVDLTGWHGLGHFVLRTRRLVVAVGGVVPTHTHEDRPSIVTVVSGEIIEHSSLCAVPILHHAGDATREFGVGHGHWWENKTDTEVVLLSSDVVPVDLVDDPNM